MGSRLCSSQILNHHFAKRHKFLIHLSTIVDYEVNFPRQGSFYAT
jgi:hypothetical protein